MPADEHSKKIGVVRNPKNGKKVSAKLRNLKRFFPRIQTQNPLYETFLGSVKRKTVLHRK
jgi:hypothetical protein